MARLLAALLLAFALASLSGLSPTPAEAGLFPLLPRSTVDRPDDIAGLQFHVVYAVPSDLADRGFDTSGGIESSTASYQGWLSTQTGGRVLRLDTYQGSADITFARLPRPDAEYVALGRGARNLIEQDLRASGLVTWRKIYGVYYDGTNNVTCGGGAWPPALPGTVWAFYLRSEIPGLLPCFWTGFAGPGDPPRYTEFSAAHEFMHNIGIVAPCAPHFHDAGHVNESSSDLMWSGSGSWNPSILDVGRDDYFQAHIPNCSDLDTSGFLTSDADFPLTVTKEGTGLGSVSSDPWTLIECGASCSASYGRGTIVKLVASTEGDSTFSGWSGACSGTGSCAVTIDAAKTVSARFTAPDRYVTVEASGRGLGTVTSRPSGLRCLPTCSSVFPPGVSVQIAAAPARGSRFLGWSGDCTGRSCTLLLDEDKYLGAVFADIQPPRIHALASTGRLGGVARLRYRVSENTRVARVFAHVVGVKGTRSARTAFRQVSAARTYAVSVRVPRSTPGGNPHFCVRASDRSGHTSRWSCATLTLR